MELSSLPPCWHHPNAHPLPVGHGQQASTTCLPPIIWITQIHYCNMNILHLNPVVNGGEGTQHFHPWRVWKSIICPQFLPRWHQHHLVTMPLQGPTNALGRSQVGPHLHQCPVEDSDVFIADHWKGSLCIVLPCNTFSSTATSQSSNPFVPQSTCPQVKQAIWTWHM